MDARADVSVVIVTRNNRRYLEPCLDSLLQARMQYRCDIVVVDNGSIDGTQELLRRQHPEIALIDNGSNVGLSRASNQGITASHGRYVLLLNDDTLVNGPSLDAMVTLLDETPRAGAVGGCLLNDDGTTQACYNYFSTLAEEFMIATRIGDTVWPGYPARMDAGQSREVDWVSSACVLLRRSALDDVGLLDEEYFIYGDEADLQYRLKQAGWSVHFIPQATTIHFGGRSLDRWRRRRMVNRGKMLFYRKHYGPLRTLALRGMLAGLSLAKLAWWGLAALWPPRRDRASRELASNMEVLKLCVRLN
jgi:GT2 family glycosyltransferase